MPPALPAEKSAIGSTPLGHTSLNATALPCLFFATTGRGTLGAGTTSGCSLMRSGNNWLKMFTWRNAVPPMLNGGNSCINSNPAATNPVSVKVLTD